MLACYYKSLLRSRGIGNDLVIVAPLSLYYYPLYILAPSGVPRSCIALLHSSVYHGLPCAESLLGTRLAAI